VHWPPAPRPRVLLAVLGEGEGEPCAQHLVGVAVRVFEFS